MKLLLDTHAFLWFVLNDVQLSEQARNSIIDSENDILISPASYWEIAIKISLGKYALAEDFTEFMTDQLQANEIRVLPISVQHAALVSTLPFHHRDPFDRLLVAQALVEEIPLVSKDSKFDEYSVSRIW